MSNRRHWACRSRNRSLRIILHHLGPKLEQSACEIRRRQDFEAKRSALFTIRSRHTLCPLRSSPSHMHEKMGGKRPTLVSADEAFFMHWNGEVGQNNVLFLTVMELLLSRPQVRVYYDKTFLLPLTQAGDRASMIRSLCGRHWDKMRSDDGDGH
ncbi:hypothetical protein CTA2_9899 [Colletotrichum tanaceti]|nr:hypothetical protein CTA2_9899 [Colletotrichum tanaceti]